MEIRCFDVSVWNAGATVIIFFSETIMQSLWSVISNFWLVSISLTFR